MQICTRQFYSVICPNLGIFHYHIRNEYFFQMIVWDHDDIISTNVNYFERLKFLTRTVCFPITEFC